MVFLRICRSYLLEHTIDEGFAGGALALLDFTEVLDHGAAVAAHEAKAVVDGGAVHPELHEHLLAGEVARGAEAPIANIERAAINLSLVQTHDAARAEAAHAAGLGSEASEDTSLIVGRSLNRSSTNDNLSTSNNRNTRDVDTRLHF